MFSLQIYFYTVEVVVDIQKIQEKIFKYFHVPKHVSQVQLRHVRHVLPDTWLQLWLTQILHTSTLATLWIMLSPRVFDSWWTCVISSTCPVSWAATHVSTWVYHIPQCLNLGSSNWFRSQKDRVDLDQSCLIILQNSVTINWDTKFLQFGQKKNVLIETEWSSIEHKIFRHQLFPF